MGFFNKKQNDTTNQPPRNPSNTIAFRLLAIGYVSYLCINMVKLYTAGGPDAPSITGLVLGLAVLGGGAAFLGFLTYREWKVTKPAYDAYMAELRAEAEAKRAAEEAEDATNEELLLEEAEKETEA